MINPALNSVPYLLILRAHIAGATRAKGEKLDLDRLWLHMVTFLQSFDPRQIRYAGAEFTSILESAAQIARQTMQVSCLWRGCCLRAHP